MLDNCGIDDYELSLLLDGFERLKSLKVFVYKDNQFLDQGLQAIKPLLTRPDPHNLLELKLVNCVTSPRVMDSMLECMVDNQVHLRSLALVKMQLH